MEYRALNLNKVKATNDSAVLYTINRFGLLSRKDIADCLSLTPAAVTKICARLMEKGLIEETAQTELNDLPGRKKVLLRLSLYKLYTIGINAEVDKITVAVVRLDGLLIKSEALPVNASLRDIIRLCKSLKENSDIPEESFVCASVCVIGAVEKSDFNLWDNEKLKNLIEAELDLKAVFENNIKAFTLSHLIYGKQKTERHTLFLKWGPGIASAIFSGGEVITGDNSSLTEIGHYIIGKGGKKCRCGRYGCLETEASTMNLLQESGCKSLKELTESDSEEIKFLIDEKTDMIALALANTATISGTQRIILFGTMFESKLVAQKLIKQCGRYNFNLTEKSIAVSSLNGKTAYLGSAAIAAKAFFFDR